MTRKILVTGATGFVGRQVVRSLVARGMRLRLVVRAGHEGKVGLPASVCEIVITENMFAESVDWWAVQCEGVDKVIHLAWYVEPGQYLHSSENLDCLVGSLNLARGAARAGVSKFVGVGTCLEYDLAAGVVSTSTPLKPLTPYAGAKAALYLGLSRWLSLHAIEFVWCRLFYLYGEGEDSRRLVPYLRSRLERGKTAELTDGQQIRDYLDVSTAGRMVADCAAGDQVGPINICSGVPVTVRQLAEKIADEYGRRELLHFGMRPDNPAEPHCVVGVPSLAPGDPG